MSDTFYYSEEKLVTRLLVMQQEVADCEFHNAPCPKLASQLNEAEILAERFVRALETLRKTLTARNASGFEKG